MTIAHSGASRSSDAPREQVVDPRLVAQPSPLGLPPHGIEHLGIDPNGDPRRRRIGRPLFAARPARADDARLEEHMSELQSHSDIVCRLLLEKKKYKEVGTRSDSEVNGL